MKVCQRKAEQFISSRLGAFIMSFMRIFDKWAVTRKD
jgi:hypothetical protein